MASKKEYHETETSLKVTCDVRVRFNETDALGIVWHGCYLNYFEDGREAFGRTHGISYLEFKAQGFVAPIVKSSCEHKLPLQYGDIATIEATYIHSAAAKMIFHYKIFNQDGNVVCTGETVQVFLNDQRELLLDAPDFFKAWQQKHNLI